MIKCSIGLLLDAFAFVVPGWDSEDEGSLYGKVLNYCKENSDKSGLVSVSGSTLDFVGDKDKFNILQYIEDNSADDSADPFEIALIFSLVN